MRPLHERLKDAIAQALRLGDQTEKQLLAACQRELNYEFNEALTSLLGERKVVAAGRKHWRLA